MEDKHGAREDRQPARPVTPERLEKAALAYLERYASSAWNLRRVLLRRVERWSRAQGDEQGGGRKQAAGWVDALVARYAAAGLVDDRAYAEAAAASLRRRGASSRKIRMKLMQKGVAAGIAGAALEETGGAGDEADFSAAVAFARRRRLGPFGKPEGRRERRMREMAALARAGFSYSIARKVIDAKGEEELEGG